MWFLKYKNLLTATICMCFITCLLTFPSSGTQGVIKGLNLCYKIIVPSLFPFSVAALLISDGNLISPILKKAEPFTRKVFCLTCQEMSIYLLSLFGGYPVGAKLIQKAFLDRKISLKKAERMLGFCVNSGPSFIIIAVGAGIMGRRDIGVILFIASLISSLVMSIFLRTKDSLIKTSKNQAENVCFSDKLVEATYNATEAMLNICGFVVLFSAVIELLNSILPQSKITSLCLSFLEISNSVANNAGDIFAVAFMLGFGGFCVHFQVLSMCKGLKINYLKFSLYRIVHGMLNILFTYLLIKTFKISVATAISSAYSQIKMSEFSVIFALILMISAVVFISSTEKIIKKSRN